MNHAHLFEETAYCTNHQGKALKAGGKWIVSNQGKSRRWMCEVCYANRQARIEALKQREAA